MSSENTDIFLHDMEVMLEYTYPKLHPNRFTYHKYPGPKKGRKDTWKDDGVCEICGKRGTFVLIDKDKPVMCYRCYQACRAYRTLLVDVLNLQKAKKLNVKQVKRIVQYMRNYSKRRALAIGAITSYLLSKEN